MKVTTVPPSPPAQGPSHFRIEGNAACALGVILISGLAFASTVILSRLFHSGLGLPWWCAVPLSITGTLALLIAALIGLFVVDRVKEKGREEVYSRWQQRHNDPVFGIPNAGITCDELTHEQLKSFCGFVSVAPKERGPHVPVEVTVSIGPGGFTEAQRQFYLRLVHDFAALMEQIRPVMDAALADEFAFEPQRATMPILSNVRIGKDTDGKLEDTSLTFAAGADYSYEELYVTVLFCGNDVVSAECFQ